MRNDMALVIVERPRIPDHSGRKGRPQPLEALPSHEGMRRRHVLQGGGKALNENLQPLRRYLERQVGRPWNKIYAEIAANLRVDNSVQQHVRDHLRDFVAVKPRRLDRGWRQGLWWQPLYVDPVTGLLCRTDRLPEEKARRRAANAKAPPLVERIPLAGNRELRRIAGLWYEVQLAPLPEPEFRPCPETQTRRLKPWSRQSPAIEVAVIVRRLATSAVRDVVTRQLVAAGPPIDEPAAWQTYRRTCSDRRYAIAKRVLARRELRQHGLQNDGLEAAGEGTPAPVGSASRWFSLS